MRLPDHMPVQIMRLPKNSAGYPIPWFVLRDPDDAGNPDFRIMDAAKWRKAVRDTLCWVCGTPMTRRDHTFVSGPMCLVNHVSAEPPCHLRCAEWSAQACPFLANPNKERRDGNYPGAARPMGGEAILRNPGVTACITVAHRSQWKVETVPNGYIVRFAKPSAVSWWAQGREATSAEVRAAIESGLPLLQEIAQSESDEAARELELLLDEALFWLPQPELKAVP